MESAVVELETIITLDDKNYDVLLLLTNILHEMGDYEEAAHYAKQAVRAAPERPDAHYLLGLSFQELGREKEAAEAFRKLEELRERERGVAIRDSLGDEPAAPPR
jgi:tetratricopeptide (TPR) repeat protein